MNYIKRNLGEIIPIILIILGVFLFAHFSDKYLADYSEEEDGSYCFPAGNWDC